MLKVSRRGGYSDRNGIDRVNKKIQLNNFDERTRNQIYNEILNLYSKIYCGYEWYSVERQSLAKYVMKAICSQPLKIRHYYSKPLHSYSKRHN